MDKSKGDQQSDCENNQNYRQMLFDYQLRISHILESFTDGYFEVSADWTIKFWNKEAERLLMAPSDEMVGKNLWEVYPEAVSLKFFTEYHRAIENNISVRFEEYFSSKDIWFEISAFPSGDGLFVYFKDITDQKNAAKQLELEKQKYRDLFNLSPLAQWVYDINTLAFLDVNEAAISLYGYSRKEFMEMTIAEIRPAKDTSSLNDIFDSIKLPTSNRNSVRHLKKNGDLIDVYIEGNAVNFEGKDARMIMVIDRTIEIQAKNAMQASVARFDIVSRATSDAIWDWNMQSGEMIWNQGIKGIFGYKQTMYNESWWKRRIHPDDLDRVTKKLEVLIQNKETRLRVKYRFRCFDGTYRSVLDRAFIIFNSDGKPIRMIGSMQDITEQIQQIQEIEAQNAKLREISWIQSHMVRGPLSNILGLAALMNDNELPSQEAKESVCHLKTAAEGLDILLRKIVSKT